MAAHGIKYKIKCLGLGKYKNAYNKHGIRSKIEDNFNDASITHIWFVVLRLLSFSSVRGMLAARDKQYLLELLI